ncbi:MAG: DUF1629 domain-containing protein [Pseudomonadota bacterium]
MNIYTTILSKGSELCHPVSPRDFDTFISHVNGIPRAATWTPIPMQLVREDQGKPLLESDSPWLGVHALIFRKRAAQALAPILESHGELLPLENRMAELLVYNVTKVVKGLDEKASSILRFDDRSIMHIQKHVFVPEVIDGLAVFKLAGIRASHTYVSDMFVSKWRAAKLLGLDFNRVFTTDR